MISSCALSTNFTANQKEIWGVGGRESERERERLVQIMSASVGQTWHCTATDGRFKRGRQTSMTWGRTQNTSSGPRVPSRFSRAARLLAGTTDPTDRPPLPPSLPVSVPWLRVSEWRRTDELVVCAVCLPACLPGVRLWTDVSACQEFKVSLAGHVPV